MKITAEEFDAFIKNDPEWATKLTAPVEVTTMCLMPHSPIEGLSKFLTFSGTNEKGVCADFTACEKLANAYGTFHGAVILSRSGVATLEGMTITKPDKEGYALTAIQCNLLKEATGYFPGYVTISHCDELEVITELEVTCGNNQGQAANFNGCQNLKAATGKYAGSVSFHDTGIETIEDLRVTEPDKHGGAASFERCANLDVATGHYPGYVSFKHSGVSRIENLIVTGRSINERPISDGWSANFGHCQNLTTAEGDFSGKVTFESSGIKVVGKLNCAYVNLRECQKLTHCPEKILKGAEIDNEGFDRIQRLARIRESMKKPSIEL